MIETIFAAILLIGALVNAYALTLAFKGNEAAMFFVCFYVTLLISDKVWATRNESFIYGFLKGLLS